jgi:hypothetical protein
VLCDLDRAHKSPTPRFRHGGLAGRAPATILPSIIGKHGVLVKAPHTLTTHVFRAPLSGRTFAMYNPGLKPWAVLCNRFAVKCASDLGYCL